MSESVSRYKNMATMHTVRKSISDKAARIH